MTTQPKKQEENFEMMLVAVSLGVRIEQPFTKLNDYLMRCQELEAMGLRVTSWYDKSLLTKIN